MLVMGSAFAEGGEDGCDDLLLLVIGEADAAWDAEAVFGEEAGVLVRVDVAGAEEGEGAEGFPEGAGLDVAGGELFEEGAGVLAEADGVEPVVGGDVRGGGAGGEDVGEA